MTSQNQYEKDPMRMSEIILIMLLDAKDLNRDYKELVKEVCVLMLDKVDDIVDDRKFNAKSKSKRLGELVSGLAKVTAYAISYAAACNGASSLEEMNRMTNVIGDQFNAYLIGSNKDFMELCERGKEKGKE